MTNSQELIEFDFQLPTHEKELLKATEVIEKLKDKIKDYRKDVTLIEDKEFVQVYEELIIALDYVGQLSVSVFNIRNDINEMYVKKFRHAPILCKKLWWEHYESLHKPYTTLKNRAYRLLDELDDYYITLYNKNPPNWKID